MVFLLILFILSLKYDIVFIGDDFMSKNFKRIIAYMLDMFLVTAIVFALTNIKQINFQLTKHNKASKEYSEIVKKYEKEEAKFNKVRKL